MSVSATPTAAELEAPLGFAIRSANRSVPLPLCHDELVKAMIPHAAMCGTAENETARAELFRVKRQLDVVDAEVYEAARDKVFELAHCGVSDRTVKFDNRAGHKLNQVMESTRMWDHVLIAKGETTEDAVAPLPRRRRRFCFVDICGGPGAFSQALFEKTPKGVSVHGYGLTLLEQHKKADFGWYPKLTAKNNFTPCFGIDGTGDIYKPENIEAFASVAGGNTCQLAVADGGFAVPVSQMAIQEALSSRIVYAQWYTALRTLDVGGCFVLKLFDTFCRFTQSLLFLSCAWFDTVEISKPLHSRAVNSERYLCCLGFRGVPQEWKETLRFVHARCFDDRTALSSLVLDEVIDADTMFRESLDRSIQTISRTQCLALQLVLEYISSSSSAPKPLPQVTAESEQEPQPST